MKEIVIKQEENIRKIYLIENQVIVEKHEENQEFPMLEGNIYIGKVQNVLPGMQAAFVNIDSTRNAFIHLKDILPKDNNDGSFDNQSDIRKLIKPGDPILVQVTRDKTYKKGARVTKHISFTGRFFVFMPTVSFITASQKITDKEKVDKLKEIARNKLPKNTGGIIRTNAQNATEEEILEDIDRLIKRYENVLNVQKDKYPKEVYNAGGILRKYILDNIDKGLEQIVVYNKDLENVVNNLLEDEKTKVIIKVENDYLSHFDYAKQLEKIENRKVWLKCGGFITIDKTEALTAVDINSGKFIGKNNYEDTIYKVNEEATIEIARQLRARDIGGIIIIDYIDMHIQENKDKILELMQNEIKKDNSKVQIEGFTKLNLLEMTRKHAYSV